jgi:hypothetical protein
MRSWVELGRKKIIEAPGRLEESQSPMSLRRNRRTASNPPLDAAECRLVDKDDGFLAANARAGVNLAGLFDMARPDSRRLASTP